MTPESSRLLLGAGPRVVEGLLFEQIAEHLSRLRVDPALLARPMRVVVPSRSLRDHLVAAMLRHFARPVVGVAVHTLHACAIEIVERAGGSPSAGEALFPVLLRQHAASEVVLRERLGELVDGYGAVEAGVSDLLDAGLEPGLVEVVDERLQDFPHEGARVPVARALLRVASRTLDSMQALELGHSSDLLRRARELLEHRGERALPSGPVWIHGFADATGVASDLIEALVRTLDASALMDVPLRPEVDPADELEVGARGGYTRRFWDRLGGLMPVGLGGLMTVDVSGAPSGGGRREASGPTVLAAPSIEAEVRAVALRVRLLLDADVAPERISLVARRPDDYALALRQSLRDLSIPFSAPSTPGPGGAAARHLSALLSLLRAGPQCPVDRWLDVLERHSPKPGEGPSLPEEEATPSAGAGLVPRLLSPPLSREQKADLRTGLRVLGAGRMAQLTRVSLAGSRRERSRGQPLSLRELRCAQESARAFCRRWESWPATARLAEHSAILRELLADGLGWSAGDPVAEALVPALESLLQELSGARRAEGASAFEAQVGTGMDSSAPGEPGLELSFESFLLLLERGMAPAVEEPLGGAGGGVQVLSVMEARARTFDQLFLLGLNRDVFPRVVREDPLLPDSLRLRLRDVLPDLPIKRTGYDEERYLFWQLMASSAHLTLSWHYADDEGKPQAPSTLIANLANSFPGLKEEKVGASGERYGGDADEDTDGEARPVPLLAREHALRAAVAGDRENFDRLLALAMSERSRWLAPALRAPAATVRGAERGHFIDAELLAASRCRVLDEMDARPEERPGLGPYSGIVGAAVREDDPRRADLFVTALERQARCSWQHFVQSFLRVDAAVDPLELLPEVNGMLLGSFVHRVLELLGARLLAPGDGSEPSLERGGFDSLRKAEGVQWRWPEHGELRRVLREEGRGLLLEAGLLAPGLLEPLVLQAEERLALLRELERGDPGEELRLVGVEVEGRLDLHLSSGGEQSLHFRADRVESLGEALRFTDFKTAKPLSTAVQAATRQRHLARAVRSGESLQAMTYALAAGAEGDAGLYLHLAPNAVGERCRYLSPVGDVELGEAFHEAVEILLQARELGVMLPRLVSSKTRQEPDACSYCEVAQACVRSDSGARRRLADWADAASRTPPEGALEQTALALWELPGQPNEPRRAGSGDAGRE